MLVTVGAAALGGCAGGSADPTAASDDAVANAAPSGWVPGRVRRSPATGHRGLPAPSQVTPARPIALVLPDGTRMPVVPVSTRADQALELPPDVGTAGWWDGGPRLGDPYGALVVAAHVDSFAEGVGPFAQLLTFRSGQRVQLMSRTLSADFEVDVVRFVPRSSLPSDPDAFARDGPLRLVLITCGGPYDADAGGYRDNVVVVAELTATTAS